MGKSYYLITIGTAVIRDSGRSSEQKGGEEWGWFLFISMITMKIKLNQMRGQGSLIPSQHTLVAFSTKSRTSDMNNATHTRAFSF